MHAAAGAFLTDSPVRSMERYGSGHINETYLAVTESGRRYILQKISTRAFHDVPALMRNIELVTAHLQRKEPDPRRVLRLIPASAGGVFWQDAEGGYWRAYDFITDSLCLDRAETPRDFYESAVGIGAFQNMLSDFPAASLTETIPHFHDTPSRYAAFRAALAADAMGRAKDVAAEIDFALSREEGAGGMQRMLSRGELPLRVTHNDTKLNNVLLDAQTRKALCVIDLDTVMPGLSANDFGDSIRFGASTASEDERDLGKVSMSLELYEAYAEGFLGACGASLTQAEREALPEGARLMTLECGVRFLTDYLQGDVYFHTSREGHNVDRCRTQFTLVADMEKKRDRMAAIIARLSPRS